MKNRKHILVFAATGLLSHPSLRLLWFLSQRGLRLRHPHSHRIVEQPNALLKASTRF